MVLGIGSDITGMNPTIDVPKMNYEVSLEATRLDGSDFFCGLTLPYGKASFTIMRDRAGAGPRVRSSSELHITED